MSTQSEYSDLIRVLSSAGVLGKSTVAAFVVDVVGVGRLTLKYRIRRHRQLSFGLKTEGKIGDISPGSVFTESDDFRHSYLLLMNADGAQQVDRPCNRNNN